MRSIFTLWASDIHALGEAAMAPPGFILHTGSQCSLNEDQRYLYDNYTKQIEALPDHIDWAFFVGDLVEGPNKKEDYRGINDVAPEYQAAASYRLIKPILDRVPVVDTFHNNFTGEEDDIKAAVFLAGSQYHVGVWAVAEEAVAKTAKAWPYDRKTGQRVYWWLDGVSLNGVHVDAAHHQSYFQRYSYTPLEREYGYLLERYGRRRIQVPEEILIVRAHVHKGYKCLQEKGVTMVSLPPIKLADKYAKMSKTPNRMESSDLGLVGIWFHPEPVNGHRVEVVPLTFDPPYSEDKELPCLSINSSESSKEKGRTTLGKALTRLKNSLVR